MHLLLVGAIALLTTQILLQASNTLHRNGRWTSVKMQMHRGGPATGSGNIEEARGATAGDRRHRHLEIDRESQTTQ